MKFQFSISVFLCFLEFLAIAENEAKHFEKALNRNWELAFNHQNNTDWKENWFLDGQYARVTSTSGYFEINTEDYDNYKRIYAVLWTKPEFKGDLKIEYDFKKVDDFNKGVNIIYIQARGDGEKGFDQDISLWSDQRKTAAMSDYFLNMHTYHMSYAAFGNDLNVEYKDYIRGRRYLPLENRGMKNTVLDGEYKDSGLFYDHEWIHVTILKKDLEFMVKFEHPKKTMICHFKNNTQPVIHEGRIGLRLMPGRISHFKNFKVSVLK